MNPPSGQPPKSALGRKLGQLMTGTGSGTGAAAEAANSAIKVDVQVSPGLGTLLRGGKFEEGPARAPQTSGQTRGMDPASKGPVICSLVAADLALCIQAAWVMLDSGGGLTGWRMVIGLASIALGAWLSCLAVKLGHRRIEP